jgi:hypothetical protein
MQLTLVGTVHAEAGLATVDELVQILDRLKPEIIFAEIPSSHVDRYRDGSHGTLEALAVARYLEKRPVAVIPVDLAQPEEIFFQAAQEMFEKVERTSPAYRRLVDQHSLDTYFGGFSYLNSDRCIQAWVDIREEVSATLDWIRDPRLHEVHGRWQVQNELRDTAMATHIAHYSDRNGPIRAAFLFGAAHMKSIFDKTRARLGAHSRRYNEEL